MTQLLQARGWYGIFGRTQYEHDDEGPCCMVTIKARPLIGWTSFEGGFQGLYYDEASRRLLTQTKLTQVTSSGVDIHLGDVSLCDPPAVRTLLLNALSRNVAQIRREIGETRIAPVGKLAVSLLGTGTLPADFLLNDEG